MRKVGSIICLILGIVINAAVLHYGAEVLFNKFLAESNAGRHQFYMVFMAVCISVLILALGVWFAEISKGIAKTGFMLGEIIPPCVLFCGYSYIKLKNSDVVYPGGNTGNDVFMFYCYVLAASAVLLCIYTIIDIIDMKSRTENIIYTPMYVIVCMAVDIVVFATGAWFIEFVKYSDRTFLICIALVCAIVAFAVNSIIVDMGRSRSISRFVAIEMAAAAFALFKHTEAVMADAAVKLLVYEAAIKTIQEFFKYTLIFSGIAFVITLIAKAVKASGKGKRRYTKSAVGQIN